MRLLIEEKDFRRLSPSTRRELIEVFSGKRAGQTQGGGKKSRRWDRPIDLTPELTNRLMHGLAKNHRRRLELFAHKNGRVSMKEILAVTNDKDLRVLSYFQGAVTRKLRRLLNDPENSLQLLGWDYDATKWDKEHKIIVDGVLYVTETTSSSLRNYFHDA